MSWSQDCEDPLNHQFSGFLPELVGLIDRRVNEVMETHQERGLIDAIARIYWDSWWQLKVFNGTSAQWPWLAEFMVFRCVKKHLEHLIGHELRPRRISQWAYDFVDKEEDPEYVLIHNSRLPDKMNGRSVRPDVALFKRDKLVFSMDVKVAVPDSSSLCAALEKLTWTAGKYQSKVYLIVAAQNLTFGAEQVRGAFEDFVIKGGKVIGPEKGNVEERIKSLGSRLYTLEKCFSECFG